MAPTPPPPKSARISRAQRARREFWTVNVWPPLVAFGVAAAVFLIASSGSDSTPNTSARLNIAQPPPVAVDRCDGIYHRIMLTTTPILIPDCSFDYEVVQGTISLNPKSGKPLIVEAGQIVGKMYGFEVVSWNAISGTAVIDYVFCPRGTHWNNQNPGRVRLMIRAPFLLFLLSGPVI